jgi:flagellar protein FliS
MQFDVNNPYFRTKVMTASREELRLMLLEGSLKFMRGGRDALAKKDWEQVYNGFTQAKAIILELMNTLDRGANPELCDRLTGLYTYMYTRLTEGSLEKDLKKVDEVIGLMEFERDTWVMLMEKLAAERATGRDPVAEAAESLGRVPPPAAAPRKPEFAGQAGAGDKRPALSISA